MYAAEEQFIKSCFCLIFGGAHYIQYINFTFAIGYDLQEFKTFFFAWNFCYILLVILKNGVYILRPAILYYPKVLKYWDT